MPQTASDCQNCPAPDTAVEMCPVNCSSRKSNVLDYKYTIVYYNCA